MPTVTSENKDKHDREFMEKKGLLKKDEDKHGHLRESGFKELSKDYEFAKSHEMEDKKKHHFNVKYAGQPERYHLRRSFSVPGMTGASEKMGEYKTPQEVTGAVNDFMAKKQQS
jgi:hypothetical protein